MSCLRACLLHWALWNVLRQLPSLPATSKRNSFNIAPEKIVSFSERVEVFAWHLKNILSWLRIISQRRFSASIRGDFFFHLMKAFRDNLVFSMVTFIVCVNAPQTTYSKISIGYQQEHKFITFWDLIYFKNCYLISVVFFSLKRKLEYGRKADELLEVLSSGRGMG